MLKTYLYGVLLLPLLAACANPTVAPPTTAADAQQSCTALEQDISRTAQLKRDAREHDRFEWRYVFIVNAVPSWYRMNKAEKAAEARLADLNRIAAAKGCLGEQNKVVEPFTPVTPQPLVPELAAPTPQPVQ